MYVLDKDKDNTNTNTNTNNNNTTTFQLQAGLLEKQLRDPSWLPSRSRPSAKREKYVHSCLGLSGPTGKRDTRRKKKIKIKIKKKSATTEYKRVRKRSEREGDIKPAAQICLSLL